MKMRNESKKKEGIFFQKKNAPLLGLFFGRLNFSTLVRTRKIANYASIG